MLGGAVARLDTQLIPEDLFAEILQIEPAHARVRTFRNAPRTLDTLDLDLLLYDDLVLMTPELTLPHPRMQERAFVLAPLSEIAPEVRHPFWTNRPGNCWPILVQSKGSSTFLMQRSPDHL